MKTIPVRSTAGRSLGLILCLLVAGKAYAGPGLQYWQSRGKSTPEPAENWTRYCSSCHGQDGAGHTRAGHMLRVIDLIDPHVQKSFTDDQAFGAIKNGLVVHGSTKMKSFKDKLSDDEIKAIVAYVRALSK